MRQPWFLRRVGAAFNDDPGAAEAAILTEWQAVARWQLPPALIPSTWPDAEPGARIAAALGHWTMQAPLPLIVFLDEIDALQNDTLISVLRQLRSGYARRPQAFPHALALIGLRDVRDYKVASGGSARLGSASPLNIKTRSLLLGDFSATDVAALYQQHTTDTGQIFTPEALAMAFDLTQGQPWLVNALAKVAVEELTDDPRIPITAAVIDAAKEVLIKRQDTHLDSLAERLRETRVQNVIAPLLAGATPADLPPDDIRFVLDLGLVRRTADGALHIANPIYEAIIPLQLTTTTRVSAYRQPDLADPQRCAEYRPPARGVPGFLAAARRAAAGHRALSRDRAALGADGLSPPGGQWRRHAGA
jgi:hypothetical protein